VTGARPLYQTVASRSVVAITAVQLGYMFEGIDFPVPTKSPGRCDDVARDYEMNVARVRRSLA
jgi:hypothetical protein